MTSRRIIWNDLITDVQRVEMNNLSIHDFIQRLPIGSLSPIIFFWFITQEKYIVLEQILNYYDVPNENMTLKERITYFQLLGDK